MDQEDKEERKEFWWSIFSVAVVLGILGVFIYFGSANNQGSSQGVEPGIGAGPGEIVTSPTPSPTPSPTDNPSPTPTPTGGEDRWP